MRYLPVLLFLFLLLACRMALGQHITPPTDSISITGAVRKPLTITATDLARLPAVDVPDLTVISHSGAVRGTLTQLKGIPLVQLLANVEIDAPNPKLLSEYFLVLIAKDGYKVVFSWNELFNNPLGNTVFVITQANGKKLFDMAERILVITTSDVRTGRRHIKSVEKILVKRFE